MLLRQEYWSLMFEDQKAYGLDVPRRLYTRRDIKQRKFHCVGCGYLRNYLVSVNQRICCTNLIANEVVDFYNMVIRIHKKYKC